MAADAIDLGDNSAADTVESSNSITPTNRHGAFAVAKRNMEQTAALLSSADWLRLATGSRPIDISTDSQQCHCPSGFCATDADAGQQLHRRRSNQT